MNKIFAIFLSALLLFMCSGLVCCPENVSTDNLEFMFKKVLPENIVYTQVPRGLIISVDGNVFFDDCDTELKYSAYDVLDKLSAVLKIIPNDFIIEDHATKTACPENLQNWELSIMRSSNIADYVTKKIDLDNNRMFNIGFGEMMPFEDNVAPDIKGLDNRVDFIIIDYEAKR